MTADPEYWNRQQQHGAQPQGQVGAYAQQTGAPQGGFAQAAGQGAAAGRAYEAPSQSIGYEASFAQPAQAAYAYGAYPPPAAQPPAKKKGKGWIVAIVIVVCLFLFTAFSMAMCTSAVGSLSSQSSISGIGDLSGDAIGVIDLDGTIQYDGSLCSPEGLKEMLDEAEANDHIKAVVLRVNSGGGTATAGEEMAEYVRAFGKPVVVSSASINASAAYEISAQADYLFVAKSTEIGAIGTAMQMTDMSGLLDKLGVNMETITSADSKDSSYGFRPLTDDERAYYQDMVDKINEMFIENVAEGRHMAVEDVRKLATGLVFTGTDAVENGLADAVGTREDAVAKAAELAGVSSYETTNLRYASYDIAGLADFLGESRMSADDIARALKSLQVRDAPAS